MPHFGEVSALVGTLRKDGTATRRDNALRVLDNGGGWLWEDATVIAFEDNSEMDSE